MSSGDDSCNAASSCNRMILKLRVEYVPFPESEELSFCHIVTLVGLNSPHGLGVHSIRYHDLNFSGTADFVGYEFDHLAFSFLFW